MYGLSMQYARWTVTPNALCCAPYTLQVFMKGTKAFPQCGFSNTVVQVRQPVAGVVVQ